MFYIKGEGISDQFDHLKFIPVGVSITHFRKKWAKAGSLENFSFEAGGGSMSTKLNRIVAK